jgi:thiamine-phosphate diphosphorylase
VTRGTSVPQLWLVTDRRRLDPDARTTAASLVSLEAWLDEAIDAGVDLIQLREADLDAGMSVALTRRVVGRAAGTPTRVVVNDRLDVAMVAGAGGAHLPGSGLPTRAARSLARELWVSRAVHTIAEIEAESRSAAAPDALVFGTVFPTTSKGPDAPVAGLERLTAAVRASAVPIIAIGGLTVERARSVIEAGAAGLAAIGVFLPPGRATGALGPARALADLRAVIK